MGVMRCGSGWVKISECAPSMCWRRVEPARGGEITKMSFSSMRFPVKRKERSAGSVPRDRGIDLERPRIDPAHQVIDALEPEANKMSSGFLAAHAVMTIERDGRIFIERA